MNFPCIYILLHLLSYRLLQLLQHQSVCLVWQGLWWQRHHQSQYWPFLTDPTALSCHKFQAGIGPDIIRFALGSSINFNHQACPGSWAITPDYSVKIQCY